VTHRPATIDDLRSAVAATPRLSIRAGGTKPGLSGSFDNRSVIDMTGLDGITEHTPEECTFTALAGTRTADIERLLAAHGQYLPFDPPLMDAGATIGGAVASGASGSCRYRYGGIRDFLIGARIVDGRGELITAGGKVVKNAAGLLLHQAMVGSCGRFGVLAELTFKVFPRAKARATVKASAGDLAHALEVMDRVQRAQFELEAIDLEAPSTLLLRLGGAADALPARVDALRHSLGLASELLEGALDDAEWQRAREFSWASPGEPLVRVPLTTPRVPALDAWLTRGGGAARRYALAGNVALVSWPNPLDELSDALNSLGLRGQVLIGPPGRQVIGSPADDEFGRRVASVLDPDGRFRYD
jgi:glycolate dehydrogenase FAD-binding subunit